jgi:cytochrome b561/polyisoprenoid-binding protein YceI
MAATRNRYTPVAVLLHWFMAAAVFFQLALGWRMEDLPKGPAVFALFQLHKSIGFILLALVVLRLAWRLAHRPPALPEAMPVWEKKAAGLAHVALYALLFGLPLTGWVLVSTSRISIPTLLFGVLPWPHLPWLAELSPTARAVWHDAAAGAHGLLAVLMLAMLVMHVGAVLKHQLLVKDTVLGHMAPGARPGWGEPRLWLLLLAAAGIFATGFFFPRLPDTRGGVDPDVPVTEPRMVQQAPVLPEALVNPPPAVSIAVAAAVSAPEPVAAVRSEIPAAPAKALKWQVEAGSALEFRTSWSGTPVEGQFRQWTADIVFSPDALADSSIEVSVDLASVASGDEQRDGTLPGEEWFDAGHFPQAVFKASRFTRLGPSHYSAQGELSLRGKTSPLTLDFKLAITGNQAVAEGSTRIDRTVFGVGQGEWVATDQIPAAVDVTFKVRAKHP